jgi:hypothetical protein
MPNNTDINLRAARPVHPDYLPENLLQACTKESKQEVLNGADNPLVRSTQHPHCILQGVQREEVVMGG